MPAFPAGLGFLAAIKLGMNATRPIEWHYVGNTPSQWIDDLNERKTLEQSLAEQAVHYADSIERNNEALGKQAKYMNWAMSAAWYGLVVTVVLGVAVFVYERFYDLA
jgi:ABC-type dipeptide/oligopeptide/nickel transport system permease component